MLNIQPTLVGKLVKLRPILESDFEPLYKAASDPLIWELHPQPLRYQRQYFKEKFFQGAIKCGGALVIQNSKGELIGSSRYYNSRPALKDIMIGYTFISRACWGSVYNRQIKHLMMNHIYQWTDIIYFTVGQNNIRSRRAVGKIGGVLLSEQETDKRGVTLNQSVVFEIEKKNFKGLV